MSTRTVTRVSDKDEGSDGDEYREGCTSMDKLLQSRWRGALSHGRSLRVFSSTNIR